MFDLVAQVAWAVLVLYSSPGKGSHGAAPGLTWVHLAFTPFVTVLEAKALSAIETPSHFEIKCLISFAAAQTHA